MYVWDVDRSTIEILAEDLNLTISNYREVGQAKAFVLRPNENTPERYRKYTRSFGSRGPRRVHAVNFQAHFDFMNELFERFPDARIKTSIADYRGAADFTRKAPNLRPVGTFGL